MGPLSFSATPSVTITATDSTAATHTVTTETADVLGHKTAIAPPMHRDTHMPPQPTSFLASLRYSSTVGGTLRRTIRSRRSHATRTLSAQLLG